MALAGRRDLAALTVAAEHHGAQPFGMMHQHLERDSPAHRIAHHPCPPDLQMVEQGDGVGAHVRKPVFGGIVRLVAMAMAARVVSDHAPSPRQPLEHPGLDPMLVRARAEAVDHQHRRAVALIEVVNLYAVGIEEGHRDDSSPRLTAPHLIIRAASSRQPSRRLAQARAIAAKSRWTAIPPTPDTRCHSKPTSSACIFRSSRRFSAHWGGFRRKPRRAATPRYGSPKSPGPTLSLLWRRARWRPRASIWRPAWCRSRFARPAFSRWRRWRSTSFLEAARSPASVSPAR